MARGPEHFQFRPGPLTDEVTVERLEALRKAAVASRPAPAGHVGIRILQTPTGWTAQTMEGRRGGEESTLGALVIEQTDTDKVRVTWGVANNTVPDNIAGEATLTETRQVWLDMTMQTVAPWKVLLAVISAEAGGIPDPEPPDPETGAPPQKVYFLLGEVTVSGGVITGIENTNGSLGGSLSVMPKLVGTVCEAFDPGTPADPEADPPVEAIPATEGGFHDVLTWEVKRV